MTYTIALTGGIASGKTLASDILKACGAYIIDTDILSREVSAKGGLAYNELTELFPECFESGELNRRKLRVKVFDNETELNKLNSVMRPAIQKLTKEYLLKCPFKSAVLVAPLLFESEMDKDADVIINIASDRDKRIERLISRDNTDRESALKILNNQTSDEVRIAKSHYTVYNNGDKEQFKQALLKVYREILERSALKY